jgi:2-oxoglutarate/2-oxoacid ferredoxin oxidoreductase subunit alpha
VPRPLARSADHPTPLGVIYYGSTSPAMDEADDILADLGVFVDLLRVRGFPFHDDVRDFIAAHDRVFIVEQNRDGQLRTLLLNELDVDSARLVPVRHFDGTPITARFIADAIAARVDAPTALPLRKVAS